MKKKISILFFVSGILLYAILVLTDHFVKFPSILYLVLALLCTCITIVGVIIYFTKREYNIYYNSTDKTKKKFRSILEMRK